MNEAITGNLSIAQAFEKTMEQSENVSELNLTMLKTESKFNIPFLNDIKTFTPVKKEKPSFDEIIEFSKRLQTNVYHSKEGAFYGILYANDENEIKLNYYNFLFTYISEFLRKNIVGEKFYKVLNDKTNNIKPEDIIVQENIDHLSESPITAYDDNLRERLAVKEGDYLYKINQKDFIIKVKEEIELSFSSLYMTLSEYNKPFA